LSAAHRLRNMDLDQCFSTFFGSRHPVRLKKIWQHPYLDKTTIWGTLTPLVVKELKKEVNSIFGGTRDTSSRHPCVPRHPGWLDTTDPDHNTNLHLNTYKCNDQLSTLYSRFKCPILYTPFLSFLSRKKWSKMQKIINYVMIYFVERLLPASAFIGT